MCFHLVSQSSAIENAFLHWEMWIESIKRLAQSACNLFPVTTHTTELTAYGGGGVEKNINITEDKSSAFHTSNYKTLFWQPFF